MPLNHYPDYFKSPITFTLRLYLTEAYSFVWTLLLFPLCILSTNIILLNISPNVRTNVSYLGDRHLCWKTLRFYLVLYALLGRHIKIDLLSSCIKSHRTSLSLCFKYRVIFLAPSLRNLFTRTQLPNSLHVFHDNLSKVESRKKLTGYQVCFFS